MQKDSIARRETFLPFSPPSITEAEIDAVVDTLRSSWITTGPKTKAFEKQFAEYLGLGADQALALNSCTAGLHVALVALGIGAGDEVITTPYTFTSSVNVIEHVGARPVLADVQADTFCIDPAAIRAAITDRTKAIIVVHFSGHPADMDAIMAIAQEHHLAVIEDTAHALPTKYKGRWIGTFGDFASFSFYATKNLTTAEGGMLVARSPELLANARVISLHGLNRDAWKRYSASGSWFYEVVTPGFKYNMTDIQAAIGAVQLERLAGMQVRRREVVALYHAHLSQLPEVQVPVELDYAESAWHLYTLRLNLDHLTIDRAQFIDEMKARNIGTSVHFIPVHIHPYYRDKYSYTPDSYPVAYGEYMREVTLPLHPGLSDADVHDVIAAVTDIVEAYRC